jgi:hypothetical protein
LAWFDQTLTELCDSESLSNKTWTDKQIAVVFALIELYELVIHGEAPPFTR